MICFGNEMWDKWYVTLGIHFKSQCVVYLIPIPCHDTMETDVKTEYSLAWILEWLQWAYSK